MLNQEIDSVLPAFAHETLVILKDPPPGQVLSEEIRVEGNFTRNQSNLLFWVVLSFTIYLRGNQAVSIRIRPMTGSSLLHTAVYPSFQQPSSFYIYSIF